MGRLAWAQFSTTSLDSRTGRTDSGEEAPGWKETAARLSIDADWTVLIASTESGDSLCRRVVEEDSPIDLEGVVMVRLGAPSVEYGESHCFTNGGSLSLSLFEPGGTTEATRPWLIPTNSFLVLDNDSRVRYGSHDLSDLSRIPMILGLFEN